MSSPVTMMPFVHNPINPSPQTRRHTLCSCINFFLLVTHTTVWEVSLWTEHLTGSRCAASLLCHNSKSYALFSLVLLFLIMSSRIFCLNFMNHLKMDLHMLPDMVGINTWGTKHVTQFLRLRFWLAFTEVWCFYIILTPNVSMGQRCSDSKIPHLSACGH